MFRPQIDELAIIDVQKAGAEEAEDQQRHQQRRQKALQSTWHETPPSVKIFQLVLYH